MPHDLAVLPIAGTLTTERAVQDRATADAFRQASKAETTIRAYTADVAAFENWCRSRGLGSCPASPDTVADHLGWCATEGRLSPSSIGRRTAAIRFAHKASGFDTPHQLGDGARGDRRHQAHARGRAQAPKVASHGGAAG